MHLEPLHHKTDVQNRFYGTSMAELCAQEGGSVPHQWVPCTFMSLTACPEMAWRRQLMSCLRLGRISDILAISLLNMSFSGRFRGVSLPFFLSRIGGVPVHVREKY
jgi:hypothetical protein